jgi:hypothetical protein
MRDFRELIPGPGPVLIYDLGVMIFDLLLFRSPGWLLFKDISEIRIFLLREADKSVDLSVSPAGISRTPQPMARKKHDRETELLARIATIKVEIASLGEIRPGSMTEQFNVCGTPNCRCKDKDNPRKHGPYHQLSYTRNNRRTSEFVRAVDLQAVLQQIADYDHFIAMKDEWIDASIELTKLRRAARQTGGKP